MFNVENLRIRYIYILLSAIAVLPIMLYYCTPLFADDFTWFTFLRDNQSKSFYNLLLTETPFGYFRPLAVLFFRAIYSIAGDSAFIYRIILSVFQVLISILIYKVLSGLSFSKTVSFWTAFIFSVLASHAEVIYLINCLNILIADFLILCGIYFLLRRDKSFYALLAIIMFFLSLLSRESSFNYIFLSLVIFFFSGKKNKLSFAVILLVPLLVYFVVRFIFAYFNPEIFANNNFELSFGIIKSIYKISHYFIISVFPVKSVFYITGFEFYDSLRSSFSGKSDPLLFYALMLFSGISALAILFYILRILKKKILFPVLFFLSCLISYIPSENVAERFSYLASAGICLLIVLVLIQSKPTKLFTAVFILFIVIHLSTLLIRGGSYKEFANSFSSAVNDLHTQLKDDNQASVVMLDNLPVPYRGQMLISTKNFNDAYKYFYPNTKTEFILKNNLSESDARKPVTKKFILDFQTFRFISVYSP